MARPRVTVKYHGKKLCKAMDKEFKRRLRKCGEMVASEVRRNISTSTRANGPSAPGEFPHADTGSLRKSISYEMDSYRNGSNAVHVGSTMEYADYLEHGTDYMDARPYLETTLKDLLPKVRGILLAPINGSGLGMAYISGKSR